MGQERTCGRGCGTESAGLVGGEGARDPGTSRRGSAELAVMAGVLCGSGAVSDMVNLHPGTPLSPLSSPWALSDWPFSLGLFLPFFCGLGFKLRASCMPGKHSSTELPQSFCLHSVFEIESS